LAQALLSIIKNKQSMEQATVMQKNIKDKRSRLFLKGIVVPSKWDDSGNITGISLAAFNEEIYHITNNGKGKELINYLGKKVEIEGDLDPATRQKKIKVNSYRYSDYS
jgi:hypothetical protein